MLDSACSNVKQSWENQKLRVQEQPSQMFFKIGAVKNLAMFTGKHLCWNLFLIKLQDLRHETLLKIYCNKGILYIFILEDRLDIAN